MTQQEKSKLRVLLQSRKFWATVIGIVVELVAFQFGHASLEATELAIISTLGVYTGATAFEDHGIAMSRKAPDVTNVTISPPADLPLAVTSQGGSQ